MKDLLVVFVAPKTEGNGFYWTIVIFFRMAGEQPENTKRCDCYIPMDQGLNYFLLLLPWSMGKPLLSPNHFRYINWRNPRLYKL